MYFEIRSVVIMKVKIFFVRMRRDWVLKFLFVMLVMMFIR